MRTPARTTVSVGIAPTQELVSRDGMMPASCMNDRVGPICRTVGDAARVLDAIAGYDPKDELTAFSVGPHAVAAVRELRERAEPRRRAHRRRA